MMARLPDRIVMDWQPIARWAYRVLDADTKEIVRKFHHAQAMRDWMDRHKYQDVNGNRGLDRNVEVT